MRTRPDTPSRLALSTLRSIALAATASIWLTACGGGSYTPDDAASGGTGGTGAPGAAGSVAATPAALTEAAAPVAELGHTGSNAPACTNEPGAKDTFYVSSVGDDAADGRSPATAWKTVARVQRAVPTLKAGQRVLFARGHAFPGSLVVENVRGASGAPITFGAYCTGLDPVITGYVALSGWQSRGGNVWEAACTDCAAALNLLTVDGKAQGMARHPNADAGDGGYLYWDSSSGATSLTDAALAGANWTGAFVAVRSRAWVLDRVRVASHSGSTLGFASAVTYSLTPGFGYFLLNHPSALDRDGEWTWDAGTKRVRLFSASGDPSPREVLASTKSRIVTLRNTSWIVFENLGLRGGNDETVRGESCDNVSLRRVSIRGTGGIGASFDGCRSVELADSGVADSMDSGVSMPDCPSCAVRRTRIVDSGVLPGMGRNGVRHHIGARIGGTGFVFEGNDVDGSGYNGVDLNGPATVTRNRVNGYNRTLSDGGGIYMWRRPGGVTVSDNTVSNGVGIRAGTDSDSTMTHGIYVDDNSTGIAVTGNTVLRGGNYGIFLHNTRGVTVTGNTVAQHRDAQVWLLDDDLGTENNTGMVFRDNLLVDTDGKPMITTASSVSGYDFAGLGDLNANRYCTPYGDPVFRRSSPQITTEARRMASLAEWRAYGHDEASTTCAFALVPFVETSRGGERVANGRFDAGVAGWSVFPTSSAMSRSTELGGNLLWSAGSSAAGTDGNVSTPAGPITAGQVYRVSWRGYRPGGQARVEVFMMRNSDPWTVSTDVPARTMGSATGSWVVYLTAKASQPDTRIAFGTTAGELPLVLDDVSVTPVTGRTMTADERLQLLTNPTSKARSVTLDAARIDVRGTRWPAGSTIVVDPFRSVALFPAP